MIDSLVQFHNHLFFSLHGLTEISPTLTYWVYLLAEKIDIYVVGVAVVFMLVHTHKYRENRPRLISRSSLVEGSYLVIGILVAWGISYLMKIGFAVPRPFLQFPDITPLFLYGGYNSFPSGHATLFAAMATAITLVHKKIGIFFIIAALLIGITRVVSGVHFPIDVVFGWLLGAGSVFFVQWYFIHRRKKRLGI